MLTGAMKGNKLERNPHFPVKMTPSVKAEICEGYKIPLSAATSFDWPAVPLL